MCGEGGGGLIDWSLILTKTEIRHRRVHTEKKKMFTLTLKESPWLFPPSNTLHAVLSELRDLIVVTWPLYDQRCLSFALEVRHGLLACPQCWSTPDTRTYIGGCSCVTTVLVTVTVKALSIWSTVLTTLNTLADDWQLAFVPNKRQTNRSWFFSATRKGGINYTIITKLHSDD